METGKAYREVRLIDRNYMGLIQYLGRRGESTPEEIEKETNEDMKFVAKKLESLEDRHKRDDLVEVVEEAKRGFETVYGLTSEGRGVIDFYNRQGQEEESETMVLSPVRRIDEGYFLEGGYVTQEKGLNSDVKVRENGGTVSNLPTVDVIEELD